MYRRKHNTGFFSNAMPACWWNFALSACSISLVLRIDACVAVLEHYLFSALNAALSTCSENIELMITDAIKQAPSEHVVYFLLTAYVETLGYVDLGIPEDVKRLPISGRPDVHERLGIMRDVLERPRGMQTRKAVVEEAVDVFGAASEQLAKL
jgi:hypothetical protein